MAYKVKCQKDFGRPFAIRKKFDTIEEADDYVQDKDWDCYEVVYEIINEETGEVEFTGAVCM